MPRRRSAAAAAASRRWRRRRRSPADVDGEDSDRPANGDGEEGEEVEGVEDGEGCGGAQQRDAANARERARMRVLSRAFCRLKTRLPWVPADTKLSKLDTLRLAASYIAHLRALLRLPPDDAGDTRHPLNLTWPFSFQQGESPTTEPASAKAIIAHSDLEHSLYQI